MLRCGVLWWCGVVWCGVMCCIVLCCVVMLNKGSANKRKEIKEM
jgi:hypothetical protein